MPGSIKEITPDLAPDLADRFVNFTKSIEGIELDYSIDSLELVDEIIEGMRREGLDVNDLYLTLLTAGCYVGEVIVRFHQLRWVKTEDSSVPNKFGSVPIVIEYDHDMFTSPISKVIKRFESGEEDFLPFYYQGLVRPIEEGVVVEKRAISDESRPDLDSLINTLLPFAEDQLHKRGCFTPFAAMVNYEGEVKLAMPHDDSAETTIPDLILLVKKGFRDRVTDNSIRATGICHDGILRTHNGDQSGDAILIDLEHKNGDAVRIARPYTKKFLKGFIFGEIIALQLEPSIFIAQSDDAA